MTKCVLVGMYDILDARIIELYKKKFELPVVAFSVLEYPAYELGLNSQDMRDVGISYSFPEYYYSKINYIGSLGIGDVDKIQLDIENDLGIRDNPMLMSFGKSYARFSDYRKSRNYQLINLMFVQMLLQNNDPIAFFNSRGTYLFNLIADACLVRHIPSMHLRMDSFTMNRLYVSDSHGRALGMKQFFEMMNSGDTDGLDEAVIEEADNCLNSFLRAPARAKVVENNARSLPKNIKLAFLNGYSSIRRSLELWCNCHCDRENGELDSPFDTIPSWPLKTWRMLRMEFGRIFNYNPDFESKYIYLPLHLCPDTTDLYFGRDYTHHEGFVTQLSKRLPSEYLLYVKDHTSMIGNRSIAFYKNLKSLPNVELIDPRISTFDMIRNCAATLTVAGTAGWEAYLYGKPVIVLGDIFYNFLPNVLHCGIYQGDFVERVRSYIELFKKDVDECRMAIRALFLCSEPIGQGYDGVHDNSILVAFKEVEVIKQGFDAWKDWILENEPLARVRANK